MTVPTARVTTPADLLGTIPALLGFEPSESLVLLALGGESGGRVVGTARVDLADVLPVTAAAGAGAAHTVAGVFGGTSAVVICYSDTDHDRDVLALADLIAECGVEVRDVFAVTGSTWRSPGCTVEGCACAGGGEMGALTDGALTARAALAAAGSAVLPSREALAASLDADPADTAPGAVTQAAGAALTGAALDALAAGEPVSDADLAAIGATWADGHAARDVLLGEIALRCDAEHTRAAAELARRVAVRTPVGRDRALVTFAALSYLAGNGAATNIALDALDPDGDYPTLAVLLDVVVSRGVGPDVLRVAFAEAHAEAVALLLAA